MKESLNVLTETPPKKSDKKKTAPMEVTDTATEIAVEKTAESQTDIATSSQTSVSSPEPAPKPFPFNYPEADLSLQDAIIKSATSILAFIRPKSTRYKIAYNPNPSGYYILPSDFYPTEYVITFDLRNDAVIVTNTQHSILVGWTKMPPELKKNYQDTIKNYQSNVRPIVESEFKEATNNFYQASPF